MMPKIPIISKNASNEIVMLKWRIFIDTGHVGANFLKSGSLIENPDNIPSSDQI